MNVKDLHTNNNWLTYQRGIISALVLACLVITFNLNATNYYVNDNSATGDVFTTALGNNANNGTSPSTPKATLTNVLATYSLSSGDTVFVDAGTYFQTERDLNVTDPIVVMGAGTELTIFDNDETGTTGYTFMRINAAVKLNNFKIYRYGRSGTYAHAVHVHSGVTGVELQNIQIDDAGTLGGMYPIEIESGASVLLNGGGLTCNNNWNSSGGIRIVGSTSQLEINNYTFYNNSRATSSDHGVCVRQEDGSVTITNSLFENNKVDLSSVRGLVYQAAGTLVIEDCLFDNNTINAPTAGTEYGGVIAISGGTFNIRRSRITNTSKIGGAGNIAGGAIGVTDNTSVSAFVDSCYFEGNNGSTSRGTDIFVDGNSTLEATDCYFLSASDQVGTRTGGTIELTNCGDPDVYTNFNGDQTIKNNIDAPRYTADPQLDFYTGDCASSVVLPVELIEFSGECNERGMNLFWSTASENNNDYFRVERSDDGFNFREIGTVLGKGNTQEVSKYSFQDYNKGPAVIYYRLSQFDYDGKSEMFNIISVENECASADLQAHYDHLNNKLKVFHNYDEREIEKLNLYSVSGQQIEIETSHLASLKGYSEIMLPVGITTGVYIIELRSINEVNAVKIIIQ